MELTKTQKNQLQDEGYVKLSGIIPQKMINVALRSINHCISKGIDPKRVPVFRSTSYCPELKRHESITDLLLKTPLWEIARSLIGDVKMLSGGGQIALRFPVMERPGAYHPHIDGTYTPNNRVPKGAIGSFTALAGVFLTDIPNQYWGNFTVWPGSHRILQDYFRKHGIESLRTRGLPPIPLPEPVQLTAKAGDAIFCHYMTVHTVVANVSPYIRYAVFFRLAHVNHSTNRNKTFSDLWLEWQGMS
jgi:ectoine hydroxylase-related dioxygenase (phytanoyl-CoA dioxygenase family)